MHGHALTFFEQMIASIIYDSRCVVSDVAFRTAPPIGVPSCFLQRCYVMVRTRVFAYVKQNQMVLGSWFLVWGWFSTVEVKKYQNGVRDLDPENEVKMQRSRNFNWPHTGFFSAHNQIFSVLRSAYKWLFRVTWVILAEREKILLSAVKCSKPSRLGHACWCDMPQGLEPELANQL